MILIYFVLHFSKASLFYSHLRQFCRVFLCDSDHILQNLVDLILRVFRNTLGGGGTIFAEIPRLLYGPQIKIHVIHNIPPHYDSV